MIRDAVSEFLYGKRRKARATTEQYARVLENVWLPWCEAEGITEAAECTDVVMERFTDHLRRHTFTIRKEVKVLAAETIRTYVRDVRLFLNWAKVPKGRYQQEKAPERLLEILSREEISRVEAAAVDERDRLIVRLLADTGIRVGELCSLRVENVRENRHDRTAAIRVIGKGNREREVPVPPATFRRLKHHAAHGGNGEYVFVAKRRNTAGKVEPLTRSGVDRVVRLATLEAQIEKKVYPHLLRHSYATWKLSKGMNPIALMKILGHRNLTMISTVYVHLVLNDTYAAMMATED